MLKTMTDVVVSAVAQPVSGLST